VNFTISQSIKRIAFPLCFMLSQGYALRAAPFVYVNNTAGQNVSIIDAATNQETNVTIPAPPSAPNFNALAVTPDGKTVYVGCVNNNLYSIDVATNQFSPDAPLLSLPGQPQSIAITPDGKFAYVGCNDGTVQKIDLATLSITQVLSGLSATIFSIAITPNGSTAYIVDVGNGSVIPLALPNDTMGTAINSISIPIYALVSPDSNYLYITNLANNNIFQFILTPDPLNPSAGAVIDTGGGESGAASHLAITSDGNTLYATLSSDNAVVPIDISNPSSPVPQALVGVGVNPLGIAITPDNTSLFVANSNDNTVTELSIANRLSPTVVGSPIMVGFSPYQVVITPTPLKPPASVSGCKTQNVFLFQTDFINNITWTAPASGNAPAAYKIYRDPALTELVATVPASGALQYYDHDRNPSVVYSYYITSIDASGNESTTASSVTVTQSC
jgi:DNA-binding beta-propeller fold protein YncE